MRDGPLRRLVKALVRGMWTAEMALRRGLAKPRWEVAGSCEKGQFISMLPEFQRMKTTKGVHRSPIAWACAR